LLSKLALGTVQFGLTYGISNQSGQVNREEVGHIIALAQESGIDTLDTAIGYGDSEECLGAVGSENFKIVTKLPGLPDGVAEINAWVTEQMQISLRRLNVDAVYGLLLHRSQQLVDEAGRALLQALERLKVEGIVQKIGVSIYAPEELDTITQSCTIDLVQAPLNLFDRRLVTSGWLQRLHDQGVEVHTRSAFLQGLLLMPRDAIPVKFERWAPLWDAWHASLVCCDLTATTACLQYPLSLSQIDRVVVGVDSAAQLRELISIARLPSAIQDWSAFVCEDENLINPSRWNML
jgi:aryl-alcohol dehydrogenase-like predicted oxidoreductase